MSFGCCRFMGCWKWFNTVLKDAGIEVTADNEERIEKIIHQYVGEKSSLGRCSADWRKARKEIQADEKMKKELVERLQSSK